MQFNQSGAKRQGATGKNSPLVYFQALDSIKRAQPEHHAHGLTALVRLAAHAAVVDEGCGLAGEELVIAHKEVDVDAQRSVVDDLGATLAGGVGGVLALPLQMGAVPPMAHVLVLVALALLVERDQQDVRLLLRQNDMAHL